MLFSQVSLRALTVVTTLHITTHSPGQDNPARADYPQPTLGQGPMPPRSGRCRTVMPYGLRRSVPPLRARLEDKQTNSGNIQCNHNAHISVRDFNAFETQINFLHKKLNYSSFIFKTFAIYTFVFHPDERSPLEMVMHPCSRAY